MFDKDEAMVMKEKYEAGMTVAKVAEEHYMATRTALDWLNRVGTEIRSSGWVEKTKDAIISDWNAGMQGKELARKYGINHDALRSRIVRWRKEGAKIDRRITGRKKRRNM